MTANLKDITLMVLCWLAILIVIILAANMFTGCSSMNMIWPDPNALATIRPLVPIATEVLATAFPVQAVVISAAMAVALALFGAGRKDKKG